MVPETRYTKTADGVHVAYQALGEGPGDIVFVMGWTSQIELMWAEPSIARFFTRLSSFSRLILFDERGMGLSAHLRGMRSGDERAKSDRARRVGLRTRLVSRDTPLPRGPGG
jgi:pimeloyl-ACP methyl ester carboxylesterase